jgi:hypothetical protein
MFLDSTTATLLLVPIIAPPLAAAGVDPVHLGSLPEPHERHRGSPCRSTGMTRSIKFRLVFVVDDVEKG